MNIILYNPIFEVIIFLLLGINILNIIKKDIENEMNKNKDSSTKLDKRSIFCIIYILILLAVFIIILLKNETTYSLVILFTLVYCFIETIKDIATNKKQINNDDRSKYIVSTLIFIIFFSSRVIPIYLKAFATFSHEEKEILALIFINTKIIMFVFSLLVNLIILIEQFVDSLRKKDINILNYFNKLKSKEFTPILYNFKLHSAGKNIKYLIIDYLIFIITTPIGLILTILKFLLYQCIDKLCVFFNKLIFHINKIYENKNDFFINVIKITMIISLTVANIIIIWENTIFSERISNIFNFISSVILIPLIYDQVKK